MSVESVRYWVAVAVVVLVPPALTHWLVVHPFIAFWRKRGMAVTFSVVGAGYFGMAVVLFLVREPLLSVRGPWSPALAVLGGVLYLAAIAIETQTRRRLSWRVLVGVPEIDPERRSSGLLTTGIYARIRNPRYLTFMIALAALTLFTNYLAVWVLAFSTWPAIRLIVHWEERELRDRFGEEYVDYCRRVPRFLPRPGRRADA
jgi:protein-S-isoprenylcysteine O-methyltransferase Ste14